MDGEDFASKPTRGSELVNGLAHTATSLAETQKGQHNSIPPTCVGSSGYFPECNAWKSIQLLIVGSNMPKISSAGTTRAYSESHQN